MIRVVRLAGESYDLETGTQLPKALVLSNGLREFALHVDDDTAFAVVQMMAEVQGQGVVAVAPGNGSSPPEPELDDASGNWEPIQEETVQMTSVLDAPEDSDLVEEDLEPGEEYNDPATGVGSL